MTDLQALKKSVQKWEKIHEGSGSDVGLLDCALCHKYILLTGHCSYCPLWKDWDYCGAPGSTYELWWNRECGHLNYYYEGCPECEKTSFAMFKKLYDLYVYELIK